MTEQEYNVKAIRELLQAAFKPRTLRRFLREEPEFQSLGANLSAEKNLDDMIDDVFDFCRTKLLWDKLLERVKAENPRQFERFLPYKYESDSPDWLLELAPAQDAVPDWVAYVGTPGPTPVVLPDYRVQPASASSNAAFWEDLLGCLIMVVLPVILFACFLGAFWLAQSSQQQWTYVAELVGKGSHCNVTRIWGTVLDAEGQPLEGVWIQLGSEETVLDLSSTDGDGSYVFTIAEAPVAGSWFVRVLLDENSPASQKFLWDTTGDCHDEGSIQVVELNWRHQ